MELKPNHTLTRLHRLNRQHCREAATRSIYHRSHNGGSSLERFVANSPDSSKGLVGIKPEKRLQGKATRARGARRADTRQISVRLKLGQRRGRQVYPTSRSRYHTIQLAGGYRVPSRSNKLDALPFPSPKRPTLSTLHSKHSGRRPITRVQQR